MDAYIVLTATSIPALTKLVNLSIAGNGYTPMEGVQVAYFENNKCKPDSNKVLVDFASKDHYQQAYFMQAMYRPPQPILP